jgi:hypothetical protein
VGILLSPTAHLATWLRIELVHLAPPTNLALLLSRMFSDLNDCTGSSGQTELSHLTPSFYKQLIQTNSSDSGPFTEKIRSSNVLAFDSNHTYVHELSINTAKGLTF